MCNCAVAIVEVLLFVTALCVTDQQLTEFNVCCNIVDLPIDFQFSRWKLVKCYITGVCRLDQLHKLTVRKLITLQKLICDSHKNFCDHHKIIL